MEQIKDKRKIQDKKEMGKANDSGKFSFFTITLKAKMRHLRLVGVTGTKKKKKKCLDTCLFYEEAQNIFN